LNCPPPYSANRSLARRHFPPEAGRPVAAANLHLTLAFLGDVSAEKQRALAAMAGRIASRALRCTSTMPASGCVRAWSGWARASRRADCCSWRICCAPRPRAAAAIKARSRFIRISPCCAMPVRPLPSRRRVSLGLSGQRIRALRIRLCQGRTRYTPLQRWTLGDKGILMKFSPALQHATLIQRYKRFLADVITPEGEQLTLHCPNTGAMTGCATPGDTVWYSTSENTKRKYAHTWEMTETQKGHLFALIPCAPISWLRKR
jgi:hypothetical protein